MAKRYSPPFVSTPTIVALIADIAERAGRFAVAAESTAALQLRRINRVRTIQGSLVESPLLEKGEFTGRKSAF